MDYINFINVDPAIRSGKPYLKGTRITVSDVLEYMASGMSAEEIVHDFPELTRSHLQACLAFAVSRERMMHQSAHM